MYMSVGGAHLNQARAYQVMTLSATGEAETPAGGSVCIRYDRLCLAKYLYDALYNKIDKHVDHLANT